MFQDKEIIILYLSHLYFLHLLEPTWLDIAINGLRSLLFIVQVV